MTVRSGRISKCIFSKRIFKAVLLHHDNSAVQHYGNYAAIIIALDRRMI